MGVGKYLLKFNHRSGVYRVVLSVHSLNVTVTLDSFIYKICIIFTMIVH